MADPCVVADRQHDVAVARADQVRTVLGWQPRLDNLDTIVKTSLEWEKRLAREPW